MLSDAFPAIQETPNRFATLPRHYTDGPHACASAEWLRGVYAERHRSGTGESSSSSPLSVRGEGEPARAGWVGVLSDTPGSSTGACVWTPPQLRVASPPHGFGFTVRHFGAFRQDARAHPVLPSKKRSERDIARAYQVRMEDQMARLAHKQQPLLRAVVRCGVATARACLAGLVGVHLHGHAASKQCFVGHDSPAVRQRSTARRAGWPGAASPWPSYRACAWSAHGCGSSPPGR